MRMGKIGVDQEVWSGLVLQAQSSVSEISELKEKTFKKNSLSRVKSLLKMGKEIGVKTKDYKQSAATDFKKMKAVAQKIKDQDKTLATKMWK
jgi:hypothetical protein